MRPTVSSMKKIVKVELARDGYPKDRKKVVNHLEACRWALMELTSVLENKLTITPEKSKIKPKKGSMGVDTAKDLQQFYTIDELAEECMEKFSKMLESL